MGIKKDDSSHPAPKKPFIYYYIIVLLITMLLNALVFPSIIERSTKEVGYNEFLAMIEQGRVKQVAQGNGQFTFLAADEEGKSS